MGPTKLQQYYAMWLHLTVKVVASPRYYSNRKSWALCLQRAKQNLVHLILQREGIFWEREREIDKDCLIELWAKPVLYLYSTFHTRTYEGGRHSLSFSARDSSSGEGVYLTSHSSQSIEKKKIARHIARTCLVWVFTGIRSTWSMSTT